MWRITRETEDALWNAAKKLLPDSVSRHKALVPAVNRRSEVYTLERDELEFPNPRDPTDLAARALFFTPADIAKIKIPILELIGRGAIPEGRLRVLDVGAGCGAMTLGLAECLVQPLEVLAIDRDRAALDLMAEAVKVRGHSHLELETRTGNTDKLGKADAGERDLIVCGSVLNELSEARASRLVESLLALLSDDGVLVIIEPALRETSRRLHRLRDHIIAGELGNIFAPCTRKLAPCPALELERDWCHEDRPFEPTPRLAKLTNATGLRSQRIKFSYLVITRRAVDIGPREGLLRVVSSLRKSKGKSELYACGDDGRAKLRLQKRDRTNANRAFERARRGQLLEVGEGTYVLHDPTKSD